MNLQRAHTEILILAVAAVLILSMSVSLKAPEPKAAAPQVSSQAHVPAIIQPATVSAAPASLQTVSVQTTGDWVRIEAVEAPAKQTRWVF
ncbi:hypothetical protein [Phytopseudomonas daroniae]|uniref:hypothetical protein n=1 Tax=Phytopseudomonas daroniae TaxID=2487519 RepID=UPI0010384560|nr:hypothetical protein [Pseudomonas daroniae]TBU75143.1 hypothetical protein DNK10_10810 [Pseudomonas daroniae]